MPRARFRTAATRLLALAYALGALMLAVTHGAPGGLASASWASQNGIDPDILAAYVLPDGTLPEICLTSPSNSDGGSAASIHCDACLLALAALSAVPPSLAQGVAAPAATPRVAKPAPVLAAKRPGTSQTVPRAPPLV